MISPLLSRTPQAYHTVKGCQELFSYAAKHGLVARYDVLIDKILPLESNISGAQIRRSMVRDRLKYRFLSLTHAIDKKRYASEGDFITVEGH